MFIIGQTGGVALDYITQKCFQFFVHEGSTCQYHTVLYNITANYGHSAKTQLN